MTHPHLAFIGAGNMAYSIIGGLIENGYPSAYISAAAPSEKTRERFSRDFGVDTNASNIEAISTADIVVLAVKPQVMKSVAQEIRLHLPKDALLVSIAAGISCDSLSRWLERDAPIVRCMPNTPSQVHLGASALFATENVTSAQRQAAEQVMAAVGLVTWLNAEEEMDAVIAVSGSGPAYYFLMMESMIAAGVKLGLSEDTARQLTLQTALGAATLAIKSGEPPAELRRRVTSPGGTTAQAIKTFTDHDYSEIVEKAMRAAADRAKAMADELGK